MVSERRRKVLCGHQGRTGAGRRDRTVSRRLYIPVRQLPVGKERSGAAGIPAKRDGEKAADSGAYGGVSTDGGREPGGETEGTLPAAGRRGGGDQAVSAERQRMI